MGHKFNQLVVFGNRACIIHYSTIMENNYFLNLNNKTTYVPPPPPMGIYTFITMIWHTFNQYINVI